MKITAPIFPMIWNLLKFYFSGLQLIFTPKLFTSDYKKHFFYSYGILTLFCLLLYAYFSFSEVQLVAQIFIFAIGGWIMNFARELYRFANFEIEVDYMDCVVGAYGAKLAPITVFLASLIV